MLVCGAIGIERGSKRQPAGFRTYMLVGLGSCLVMMTNQFICDIQGAGDPSRLGAQVISGIGFLGAGTILVTRNNQVRGLTTAAGLWSSACIGLAIGIGFYEGAIVVGVCMLLIMTVLQKLDYKLQDHSSVLKLYLNFISSDGMNGFMDYCSKEEIKIIDMQLSKPKGDSKGEVIAYISIKMLHKQPHPELIHRLSELEGLKYIEEL